MKARRMAGFIGSGSIMVVAGVALLLIALTHAPAVLPPEPGPPPATPGVGIAYAPYVFHDSDTGCQYLSTHLSTRLVPRIAADGKTHTGCKGPTQ